MEISAFDYQESKYEKLLENTEYSYSYVEFTFALFTLIEHFIISAFYILFAQDKSLNCSTIWATNYWYAEILFLFFQVAIQIIFSLNLEVFFYKEIH